MNENIGQKTFTKIKLLFWITFSITLGIFLTSIIWPILKFGNFKEEPVPLRSEASAILSTAKTEKPKYFYLNKNADEQPKLSAEAYLVGDLNTGEVILAKMADKKFPIASVSKLMTAFVAEELAQKDDVAEVSRQAIATPGENGNFYAGEKIKVTDLLYPLLLESSNDAAEIIAEYFGRDSFIRKMNQEALRLTMSDTSYEDPTGLSPKNQSTVSDLFKLAGYLDKTKPELLQLTMKRNYSNKTHNWPSTNQFLQDPEYMGGKSGYTDPALQTVVSIFSLPLSESGSRPISIVLLHSVDRYKDVETILKYLKKNVYYGGVADANTNWVAEKIGLPDIREPDFVTMTFGGDMMLDRGVKNSVIKNFNNDYSALFEKLGTLKDSDIFFATLEGPASDQGAYMHNLYSFRMDPAVIPALAGAGIDVLSVANNHIGDWGHPAFVDTLSRLKENEILYTGGGNNSAEAEQPTVIEKYGMKIGFLGFSDKGPDSMKANSDQSGILLTSDPRYDEIIKNASKQVDYLIVSFQFGEEYQAKHDARQEELAHKAVDDGAKIIIGSHAHVVQDTEIYKNSYIAYSLGNFIFDQSFSADTMQGMLLNIKLANNGQMSVRKDTVKLNSAFQPNTIIKGAEEKVKF
jgi:D-alanyl-D-alanine carboxypeptidase